MSREVAVLLAGATTDVVRTRKDSFCIGKSTR